MNELILDEEQNQYKYASFGVRLGAYIIDGLIISIVGMLLFYGNIFYIKSGLLAIILMLLTSLYQPLLEWKYQATWGKMLLNIKVINEKGSSITFAQAFMRYLPFIVPVVFAIPLYWLIFTDSVLPLINGWSDYIAAVQYDQLQKNGIWDYLSLIGYVFPIVTSIMMVNNNKFQALHDKWAGTYCIYNFKKYGGNVKA